MKQITILILILIIIFGQPLKGMSTQNMSMALSVAQTLLPEIKEHWEKMKPYVISVGIPIGVAFVSTKVWNMFSVGNQIKQIKDNQALTQIAVSKQEQAITGLAKETQILVKETQSMKSNLLAQGKTFLIYLGLWKKNCADTKQQQEKILAKQDEVKSCLEKELQQFRNESKADQRTAADLLQKLQKDVTNLNEQSNYTVEVLKKVEQFLDEPSKGISTTTAPVQKKGWFSSVKT